MKNQLILGDSLEILKKWSNEGKEKFIDLVYNDPPFNSNKDYNILFNPETNTSEEAFKDTWSSIKYFDLLEDFKHIDINFYNFLKTFEILLPTSSFKAYIIIMGIIYWYIYKMLKDTGSIYHHCDPGSNSYMKTVLNNIFGLKNFRNEIVWPRNQHPGSSWKTGSKQFGRDHDTILFYTKSNKYTFNQQIKRKWTIDELKKKFNKDDCDGKGPYYWNNLCYYTNEKYKELERKGEVKWPEGNKFPRYKFYLSQSKGGVTTGDVWNHIKPLEANSKEKEYPTQKPLALPKLAILTSSNKGELLADFFMGGGTSIISAVEHQRNFIGVDINHRAIQITKNRLDPLGLIPKRDYYIIGIPKSSKELRELVNQNIYGKQKNSKFALEEITTKWYLNGVVGNKKQVGDHSIDGRFSFDYQNKTLTGIVQITSSASINHLKAFCSEISKGTGDIGVYITFEDTLTKGMLLEAKGYGRIGNVDKIQILTFENLIDKGTQFEVPIEVKTT